MRYLRTIPIGQKVNKRSIFEEQQSLERGVLNCEHSGKKLSPNTSNSLLNSPSMTCYTNLIIKNLCKRPRLLQPATLFESTINYAKRGSIFTHLSMNAMNTNLVIKPFANDLTFSSHSVRVNHKLCKEMCSIFTHLYE